MRLVVVALIVGVVFGDRQALRNGVGPMSGGLIQREVSRLWAYVGLHVEPRLCSALVQTEKPEEVRRFAFEGVRAATADVKSRCRNVKVGRRELVEGLARVDERLIALNEAIEVGTRARGQFQSVFGKVALHPEWRDQVERLVGVTDGILAGLKQHARSDLFQLLIVDLERIGRDQIEALEHAFMQMKAVRQGLALEEHVDQALDVLLPILKQLPPRFTEKVLRAYPGLWPVEDGERFVEQVVLRRNFLFE